MSTKLEFKLSEKIIKKIADKILNTGFIKVKDEDGLIRFHNPNDNTIHTVIAFKPGFNKFTVHIYAKLSQYYSTDERILNMQFYLSNNEIHQDFDNGHYTIHKDLSDHIWFTVRRCVHEEMNAVEKEFYKKLKTVEL